MTEFGSNVEEQIDYDKFLVDVETRLTELEDTGADSDQIELQRQALRELKGLIQSGSGWEVFAEMMPLLFKSALDGIENNMLADQRNADQAGADTLQGNIDRSEQELQVSISVKSLRRRGWGKDIRVRRKRML